MGLFLPKEPHLEVFYNYTDTPCTLLMLILLYMTRYYGYQCTRQNVQSAFSTIQYCFDYDVYPIDFVLNHENSNNVKNVDNSYAFRQLRGLVEIHKIYIPIIYQFSQISVYVLSTFKA